MKAAFIVSLAFFACGFYGATQANETPGKLIACESTSSIYIYELSPCDFAAMTMRMKMRKRGHLPMNYRADEK